LEKLRDVLTRLEQHKVRAALHHCQGNKIGLRFETPTEQWTIEVFQGGRGRTECEPVDATGQHIASPLQQTLWSWAAADSSGRKQDTPHVGEDPVDPSVASGDGVPPCPKCQSKDARCFCRDVGGVGYLDEYTFSCPACGYLKRETEYGGSWADNWTTRCPFCGETCHRHKATPSDFWFAAETGMRTSDEE
jgi:hypothetical protein